MPPVLIFSSRDYHRTDRVENRALTNGGALCDSPSAPALPEARADPFTFKSELDGAVVICGGTDAENNYRDDCIRYYQCFNKFRKVYF